MKERIASLDLIRSFAIVFVILTHSTEVAYGALSVETILTIPFRSQLCALVLHTIGRLGVPLFLLLSGYLLLDRSYDSEETLAFWKHTLPGMILSTEMWILIYYFTSCFNGLTLNISDLLLQMLFLRPAQAYHLWYMPMVIGIYLFLPFIANLLKHIQTRILFIPFGIMAIYLLLPPYFNVILTATGRPTLSSGLDVSFVGGFYGLIMILGWCVKKGYLNRIKILTCGLTGLLAFTLTLIIQFYAYANGIMPNVWYDFGTLIIAALSLFVLIVRINRVPFKKLITFISTTSLGVFFCHYFVLNRLIEVLPITTGLAGAVLLFILTLLISWSFVGLISQTKVLKKVLFNMR